MPVSLHLPVNAAPAKPKAPHFAVGTRGEEIVRKHLETLGYKIRATNIRIHHDEIDIIAFDPSQDVMVFVEVKSHTRAYANFPPSMNANHKKKRALRRAMHRWIAEQDYRGFYRMDLVCVVGGKVTEHIKELGGI